MGLDKEFFFRKKLVSVCFHLAAMMQSKTPRRFVLMVKSSPRPNDPTQLTVLLEALGSLQEDQIKVGLQIKKTVLVKIYGLY